jgi:plasmid stability protein
MPVSLSIKNVPDDVVDRLRDRAKRNRRSLQGELLVVVEQAAVQPAPLALGEIYQRARARGITSERNDSVEMVRRMRDEHTSQQMNRLGRRPSNGRRDRGDRRGRR